MPANYAHYRFGAQALGTMEPELRLLIQQNRRLYDMGLHGPDLFFYYNPIRSTKIGALGGHYHALSGAEFFSRAVRRLRLQPSEDGEAYLYGVLGHYCLDSTCHPHIERWDRKKQAGHVEIETEFDRCLLELDGKTPAFAQDISPHMHIDEKQSQIIARFYPPATARNIRRCAGNMVFFTRLLSLPDKGGRGVLERFGGITGETNAQMIMTRVPNPRCEGLDALLLALYGAALEKFPAMVRQLTEHLTYGAPLKENFTASFGG